MPSSSFKKIKVHRLQGQVLLQRPVTQRRVTMHSPAIDAMSDFAYMASVTITPDASLFAANETMIARGVRLLLVVDEEKALIGVISTRDTLGERPMQMLHHGKSNLFELTVADLMRPSAEIDLLDLADVKHASVGDVVATLKDLGLQHLLVATTDPEDARQRVCGVFSATQIGRQLGVTIDTFEIARTFAEIEAALAN